jgi:protease secretion system outer membrane protein
MRRQYCLWAWHSWAVVSLLCAPACAADLVEAFQRAQLHDENFLAALASHEASQELIPQAKANLLPSMNFSTLRMNNRLDKTDAGIVQPLQTYNSNNRTLSLHQAIVRPQAHAQLEQARAQTTGARHDLARSHNELALRIASTYIDVLYAEDQLQAARAQARLLSLQRDAASRAFQEGYGTRTEIDEAQARLEQAEAAIQQLQSARAYALEQLSLFAGVSDPVPLTSAVVGLPDKYHFPALTHWIERGQQDSPDIQFGRMKLQAAQLEIRKASAGHWPTLDLVAQVSDSRNENIQYPTVSYLNKQIGVQLVVPLVSGGATQSVVRQAQAQAQREEHLLQAAMLDNKLQITREYANVVDGGAKTQAGIRALQASRQTLLAMEKSLQAGYRTRLDVLNAIERISATEKDLMLVRYQTLLAWLKLQLLSGVPAQEAMASTQAPSFIHSDQPIALSPAL